MFLHKYKIPDVGTVFLVSGKQSPGKLNITLPSTGRETISGESVKNFLSNIEGKFREEPVPEKTEEEAPVEEKKEAPVEEKKEAPVEEKKPDKKATIATVIRQFVSNLKD